MESKHFRIPAFLILLICSFMFCRAHEVSYSGCNSSGTPLDHLLVNMLNFRGGTFVEVGAHNGLFQSNTKLLEEKYDWTGILVEPSPSIFETLCLNRPNSTCFQCALGSFEEHGTEKEGDFDGGPMASFTGRTGNPLKIKVEIRSLQSILDQCGISHVHLFSLDTEGYELNILQGIDFSRTTFDHLIIEIYTHQYQDIVSYLSDRGYDLVECISNYNKAQNPGWDGTHNDYLFRRRPPTI